MRPAIMQVHTVDAPPAACCFPVLVLSSFRGSAVEVAAGAQNCPCAGGARGGHDCCLQQKRKMTSAPT